MKQTNLGFGAKLSFDLCHRAAWDRVSAHFSSVVQILHFTGLQHDNKMY